MGTSKHRKNHQEKLQKRRNLQSERINSLKKALQNQKDEQRKSQINDIAQNTKEQTELVSNVLGNLSHSDIAKKSNVIYSALTKELL